MPADREAGLLSVVGGHRLGVLATIQPDGRPHLSNIIYAFDPARRLVRVSLTDGRVKTRNLRRDPRATLHVNTAEGWVWAAAEGVAELTPVAADPADATVGELVDLYRSIEGEHPDWDDYRRAMVADRRLVLRLRVDRLYGQPPT
ncbi:PPOX class F420-dependent oxidoreductase [Polymorphospora rubra]|uniref:PPOX class F420-dependent enzyme n=1 Tax=Polymorphospora rubra TaxID=338584 RepID=A0A810MVE3_9ACTN|nr:PPOX class F420-dependent oxidoreductase [Polymorphospora rubra]BCJ63969.1 PPOX class F420-dependent enzyme [Polymorphospora rubra]